MLKRTLIMVAIAATLPTLAVAQSRSPASFTAVNPDDSGYHAVVSENPYQAKAFAPVAASSSTMAAVVNPDDSGYHAVVTENPYKGNPAASRSSLSSTLRAVVNPDDSGYLGPVN